MSTRDTVRYEPHVTWCPRCVTLGGSRVLATVVYLGGWMRVERCDSCKWCNLEYAR